MSVFEKDPPLSGKVPAATTVAQGSPGFSDIGAREDHIHGLNLSDAGLDISTTENALVFYHQDPLTPYSKLRWSKNTGSSETEELFLEGPYYVSGRYRPAKVNVKGTPTDQQAILDSGLITSTGTQSYTLVSTNESGASQVTIASFINGSPRATAILSIAADGTGNYDVAVANSAGVNRARHYVGTDQVLMNFNNSAGALSTYVQLVDANARLAKSGGGSVAVDATAASLNAPSGGSALVSTSLAQMVFSGGGSFGANSTSAGVNFPSGGYLTCTSGSGTMGFSGGCYVAVTASSLQAIYPGRNYLSVEYDLIKFDSGAGSYIILHRTSDYIELGVASKTLRMDSSNITLTGSTRVNGTGYFTGSLSTESACLAQTAFAFLSDGAQDTGLFWISDGACVIKSNGNNILAVNPANNLTASLAGGTGTTVVISGIPGGVVQYNTSRRAFKNNIQPLDQEASLLDQLVPVSFTWKVKDDEKGTDIEKWKNWDTNYGFVVDDVAEIDPHLVTWMLDDDDKLAPVMWRETHIIALLVKEVQNIRKQLESNGPRS